MDLKRKTKKISYSPLPFNNNTVLETSYQKHLDIFLDARLKFEEHFTLLLSNYYQGKQKYKAAVEITKSFAETSINNNVQSFSETIYRLWQDSL